MITDKLSQIADRKQQFEELEKNSKINELFELIQKTEKSRSTLPTVLQRLETLNDLQEQALQFSSGLSYLDSLETQIAESMKTNEQELHTLKISFETNVDSDGVIKSMIWRTSSLMAYMKAFVSHKALQISTSDVSSNAITSDNIELTRKYEVLIPLHHDWALINAFTIGLTNYYSIFPNCLTYNVFLYNSRALKDQSLSTSTGSAGVVANFPVPNETTKSSSWASSSLPTDRKELL
ncbi:unnamed protein product, partial [Medioppia subpectinata]